MNALAKLETEAPYKDRFTFAVIAMSSEKGKASTEKYEWGPVSHGLVVLAPDKDDVKGILKGHNYERAEIVELLDGLLK